MDERKIYFLSTGRSGSSFFYTFFNEYYPELSVSHQSFGSRLFNILGNLPISESFKKILIRKLFVLIKGASLPNSTVDPLLSLSILFQLRNKNLEEESIKIVHLVRDPRTFVPSFINWKNSSFKRKILHHLIPFWQPSPKFEKKLKFMDKAGFNKFKQFCYVWTFKNQLIKETFENLPNYYLLRMEDITSHPNKNDNLSKLINFLELPFRDFDLESFSKKKVNKSSVNSFPPFIRWSDKQKKYLFEQCEKLMRDFGYM